jgi:hypothetical protein
MKNFSAFLLLFALSISAGSVMIGGSVQMINKVTQIASCTVDNNTKSYEVSFTFKNGGKFIDAASGNFIQPYSFKITASGTGMLGQGITPLINKEMLPLNNNQFIWQTENQATATVDYGLNILASWNAEGAPAGLYQETIITTIVANE